VQRVLAAVERRGRDLALLSNVLARLERASFKAPRLCELRTALDTTAHPGGGRAVAPSERIAQLGNLLDLLNSRRNQLFLPLAYLLMWGTQMAHAIESWRAVAGPAIARWLAVVGEFEALCSLASYAYENPGDPFPEIVAEGTVCYDGEQMGHPLLPVSRCVRNDLRLTDRLRVLIVSGSNMSGKSTFLRTVGINAVLALAGAPVRAHRLRLSPLAIGATLRIQDSLQAGRSRFYAEILRVRQIVDLTRGPLPLLFLLDEIFAGTNSHDRRLGAESVVAGLVQEGALGLVTTHDLSLTHIAEQLDPRAANVHFADHFENGVMTFDYRLQPGVVQHSNALALMRAVGLEV
jgi:DNA mismatch repair ATPase MutS